MKIVILFSSALVLSLFHAVSGQERLSPNQAVSQNIGPGKTHSYSISLNDGDYAGVSFSRHGRANLFILNPDGSVMRRLPGVSGEFAPPGRV